jgi:hypothetical protein
MHEKCHKYFLSSGKKNSVIFFVCVFNNEVKHFFFDNNEVYDIYYIVLYFICYNIYN